MFLSCSPSVCSRAASASTWLCNRFGRAESALLRGGGLRHRTLKGQAMGSDLNNLRLPAPTAWPLVLALGVTLVFAGLVTSASVSGLGAILFIAGVIGWFRNVLPHEAHESVPVLEQR